jgi:hypothetical protein
MDTNPYAAPREMEPAPPPTEAEATRREYLKHEASLKGAASLYFIGGIFLLLLAGIALSGWETLGGAKGWVLPLAGGLGAGSILSFAVASGLRKLKSWARISAVVLSGLGIVLSLFGLPASVIGLLIHAYILYILLSPKSTMVCSDRYREIVAATSQIKSRTPVAVWIGFGLFLLALIVWSSIDR